MNFVGWSSLDGEWKYHKNNNILRNYPYFIELAVEFHEIYEIVNIYKLEIKPTFSVDGFVFT